jgi:hypothetical protein
VETSRPEESEVREDSTAPSKQEWSLATPPPARQKGRF